MSKTTEVLLSRPPHTYSYISPFPLLTPYFLICPPHITSYSGHFQPFEAFPFQFQPTFPRFPHYTHYTPNISVFLIYIHSKPFQPRNSTLTSTSTFSLPLLPFLFSPLRLNSQHSNPYIIAGLSSLWQPFNFTFNGIFLPHKTPVLQSLQSLQSHL